MYVYLNAEGMNSVEICLVGKFRQLTNNMTVRIDKVTLQIFCQNNNFVIKLKPLLRIHCISHCPILPSTLNKLNTLPTFPNQENPLINCFLASCHSLSVNFDRLMVFLLPFILHSKLIKKIF